MNRLAKLLMVVTLVLFAANMGYGQIGFKGVGGKVGFVAPEDPIESTFGLGVVADLGTITPDIHLGAFADYWGKSYDIFGAEASFSLIVIGAAAKYYFPMENSKFKPYAGGRLGFAIGKSKVTTEDIDTGFGIIQGGETSASDTDLAFRILGGGELELSPGLNGFVEVIYELNGVDFFGVYVGIIKALGQ